MVLNWSQDARETFLQLFQKHKKEKARTPKTLLFVCKKKMAAKYSLDFVDEEERKKLGLKNVSK